MFKSKCTDAIVSDSESKTQVNLHNYNHNALKYTLVAQKYRSNTIDKT